MCTLVVVFKVWASTPLLVAANRDERLGRPAIPPAEYEIERTRVFGPRDAEAGGTWLGLNEHGVFAGITNRFGLSPVAGRRSRGLLVTDALAESNVEAAVERTTRHQASDYNGYHLVMASRDEATLVYNDGSVLRSQALEPGVHVFTERSLGAADAAREHFVRQAFLNLITHPTPPDNDAIIRILSVPSTPEAPFDGTVMDVAEFDYGTRSSTILRVTTAGLSLWYADGPPSVTAYERFEPFSKA